VNAKGQMCIKMMYTLRCSLV